ncbi:PspC domain-containing protein [Zhihengliuella sp.]|uniref:PspC domain-containing protein n=1 Tax=Zhihengliuella sp. TaxID=1954483 RepID=UPI002810AFDB|nr:PspC domain-containing protein [Zhihengliuella sp.]
MNPTPENSIFRWLRSLGVARSSDRWIGGVAGGLADRTRLDPILVRGLTALVVIFTGFGLLLYGAAWALLPGPDGRIHAQEVARGNWTTGFTGALVVTLIGLFGWFRPWDAFDGGFDGGDVILLLIVGLVAWFLIARTRRNDGVPGPAERGPTGTTAFAAPDAPSDASASAAADPSAAAWPGGTGTAPAESAYTTPTYTPPTYTAPTYTAAAGTGTAGTTTSSTAPPRPPKPPRPLKPMYPTLGTGGTLIWLGLAVLAGGAVFLLDVLDFGILPEGAAALAIALAVALGVLSLGVVTSALAQRSGGALTGWTVLTLIAALLFGGLAGLRDHGPDRWGQDWNRPFSIDSETGERGYVFSDHTLDMTGYAGTITDDVTVPLALAFSDTTIRVPDSIPVYVDANSAFADLTITRSGGAGSDGGEQEHVQEFEGLSGPNDLLITGTTDGPALRLVLNGAFNEVTIDVVETKTEEVTP